MDLPTEADPVRVVQGDALEVLRSLPDASFDAVFTDPPYPCIKREYGYWTEAEWFALMDPVVAECRRVLRPTGSAVFVLQPNSERVGRMRTWLWEFLAKWGKEWGVVQDAYWWNYTALPLTGTSREQGLMRSSLKPCVWLGPADCYRDQLSVLWEESSSNVAARAAARLDRGRVGRKSIGGLNDKTARGLAAERGGTTPFNVLPIDVDGKRGDCGHGARTPTALARWWVRYVCPPGGLVLDPFLGSGTTALACVAEGRRCVGVERHPPYVEICRRRIADALKPGLLAGAG